ncbi:2-hydroxychromene-2-carboxylate isomerase [Pseudoprimorskyibacter insulae]|uniref:2-hydroxychromene-2-carboxylate isomerase n=1 Tax=Pseudoprimorskyibacter insulae TaxID=1695997 RepID=A0A2R8ANW4_9RHOB|nr:2-hydroxychromene-2-carboxylate isomerase [Pseudoprimorskyibacter insulae]SPF77554.1 2-hydroxychromene-2-carboxylate isomerase [Pseudoprimorskyibacter insulae]
MAQVTYYFSLLSPYAYLAGTRLEEVADRHGASIEYRPYDIMALFARTGGTPLPERHPSRNEYRAQDLTRQTKHLGLPFNLKPAHWPTNAAPASYALIAAQKAGGNVGALTHGFLRAVWAEQRDIAQYDVIHECLAAAGFHTGLADKGLFTAADTYSDNLEKAVNDGVFGSPFYVTDDGARFFGQDRLDYLDAHLAEASV